MSPNIHKRIFLKSPASEYHETHFTSSRNFFLPHQVMVGWIKHERELCWDSQEAAVYLLSVLLSDAENME